MKSLRNHLSGLAAEESVCRSYTDAGFELAAKRWRGVSGELDLVFRNGREVVFVEVKKSRTFASAAESLGARQIARIVETATEFVGSEPMGQLTDMRFDLALVDQTGAVEILENGLVAA